MQTASSEMEGPASDSYIGVGGSAVVIQTRATLAAEKVMRGTDPTLESEVFAGHTGTSTPHSLRRHAARSNSQPSHHRQSQSHADPLAPPSATSRSGGGNSAAVDHDETTAVPLSSFVRNKRAAILRQNASNSASNTPTAEEKSKSSRRGIHLGGGGGGGRGNAGIFEKKPPIPRPTSTATGHQTNLQQHTASESPIVSTPPESPSRPLFHTANQSKTRRAKSSRGGSATTSEAKPSPAPASSAKRSTSSSVKQSSMHHLYDYVSDALPGSIAAATAPARDPRGNTFYTSSSAMANTNIRNGGTKVGGGGGREFPKKGEGDNTRQSHNNTSHSNAATVAPARKAGSNNNKNSNNSKPPFSAGSVAPSTSAAAATSKAKASSSSPLGVPIHHSRSNSKTLSNQNPLTSSTTDNPYLQHPTTNEIYKSLMKQEKTTTTTMAEDEENSKASAQPRSSVPSNRGSATGGGLTQSKGGTKSNTMNANGAVLAPPPSVIAAAAPNRTLTSLHPPPSSRSTADITANASTFSTTAAVLAPQHRVDIGGTNDATTAAARTVIPIRWVSVRESDAVTALVARERREAEERMLQNGVCSEGEAMSLCDDGMRHPHSFSMDGGSQHNSVNVLHATRLYYWSRNPFNGTVCAMPLVRVVVHEGGRDAKLQTASSPLPQPSTAFSSSSPSPLRQEAWRTMGPCDADIEVVLGLRAERIDHIAPSSNAAQHVSMPSSSSRLDADEVVLPPNEVESKVRELPMAEISAGDARSNTYPAAAPSRSPSTSLQKRILQELLSAGSMTKRGSLSSSLPSVLFSDFRDAVLDNNFSMDLVHSYTIARLTLDWVAGDLVAIGLMGMGSASDDVRKCGEKTTASDLRQGAVGSNGDAGTRDKAAAHDGGNSSSTADRPSEEVGKRRDEDAATALSRRLSKGWRWQWEGGTADHVDNLLGRSPLRIIAHAEDAQNNSRESASGNSNSAYNRGKRLVKFNFHVVSVPLASSPTFSDSYRCQTLNSQQQPQQQQPLTRSLRVYTCRSFDMVAHEVGHAILDSLCPRFLKFRREGEVAALHEGFGDVCAIFSLITRPEVRKYAIVAIVKERIMAKAAEEEAMAMKSRRTCANTVRETDCCEEEEEEEVTTRQPMAAVTPPFNRLQSTLRDLMVRRGCEDEQSRVKNANLSDRRTVASADHNCDDDENEEDGDAMVVREGPFASAFMFPSPLSLRSPHLSFITAIGQQFNTTAMHGISTGSLHGPNKDGDGGSCDDEDEDADDVEIHLATGACRRDTLHGARTASSRRDECQALLLSELLLSSSSSPSQPTSSTATSAGASSFAFSGCGLSARDANNDVSGDTAGDGDNPSSSSPLLTGSGCGVDAYALANLFSAFIWDIIVETFDGELTKMIKRYDEAWAAESKARQDRNRKAGVGSENEMPSLPLLLSSLLSPSPSTAGSAFLSEASDLLARVNEEIRRLLLASIISVYTYRVKKASELVAGLSFTSLSILGERGLFQSIATTMGAILKSSIAAHNNDRIRRQTNISRGRNENVHSKKDGGAGSTSSSSPSALPLATPATIEAAALKREVSLAGKAKREARLEVIRRLMGDY